MADKYRICHWVWHHATVINSQLNARLLINSLHILCNQNFDIIAIAQPLLRKHANTAMMLHSFMIDVQD